MRLRATNKGGLGQPVEPAVEVRVLVVGRTPLEQRKDLGGEITRRDDAEQAMWVLGPPPEAEMLPIRAEHERFADGNSERGSRLRFTVPGGLSSNSAGVVV